MLNNIILSNYQNKNSIIHKLNPIIKIISIFFILLYSIISEKILYHFILLLFIIVIILLTKISYKNYLKIIFKMKYFLIMIFLFNLIFNITINENIIFILRLIEIVLYSKIISFTTSIYEINYALNTILKPLKLIKINPNIITTGLTLSIRFIPIIIEQFNKIIKIFISKGIDFKKSNFKNKLTIIKYIVINSFYISIKKADNIANMMELKYFDLNNNKSYYFTYKINFIDIIYLLIVINLILFL